MKVLFPAPLFLLALFVACGSACSGDDNGKSPSGAHSPTDASTNNPGTSDAAPILGGPGCGFANAAFCDTFDAPSKNHGRGGDLDATFWSAGRMHPGNQPTAGGRGIGVGMSVIPDCRTGVMNQVWVDQDTLICDANADVKSSHLLASAASQNYGQNSYRIRQPFDFAGRTGSIVFDASASPLGPLFGWISVGVTADPVSVPGFAILSNDEGTAIPKDAFEVQFLGTRASATVDVDHVHVFSNYKDTVYSPDDSVMKATYQVGKLNHYEVLVSVDQIEVRITPFSDDGTTFAAPTSIFKMSTKLSFSRGYVEISVHNHATLKYTGTNSGQPKGFGEDVPFDTVNALFDNVGFDGPVINQWREYEVPNSLTQFTGNFGDPYNTANAGYDVGYILNDSTKGPGQTLHFKGVDTAGATSAKIALTTWYLVDPNSLDQYTLMVRMNGNAWHNRPLSAEEISVLKNGPITVDPSGAPVGMPGSDGALLQTVDIPIGELVSGDNTIEFQTLNIPTNYPPAAVNIDLILTTQ